LAVKSVVSIAASYLSILAGLTGCAAPIDAPSAFSEEQYLCNADRIDEFNARVEVCRRVRASGGACGGYLSFQGIVDSQPVVVDSAISRVDSQTQTTAGVVRNGLILWSSSPYFDFRFSLVDKIMPGSLIPVSGTDSNVDIMNLEARGGNYFVNWTNETRDVLLLTSDELRFTFSTDLQRGGHLDGCVDTFLPAE
jgi:hypothetical protein